MDSPLRLLHDEDKETIPDKERTDTIMPNKVYETLDFEMDNTDTHVSIKCSEMTVLALIGDLISVVVSHGRSMEETVAIVTSAAEHFLMGGNCFADCVAVFERNPNYTAPAIKGETDFDQ